jgi:alpha-glucuronidase
MEYPTILLKKIEASRAILTTMIESAKKQGVLNYDTVYVLHDGLQELQMYIESKEKISPEFLNKWNRIMGWVPRVFEGQSLLDLIIDIDRIIDNV